MKMTISLPDELYKRMRNAKDVVWSHVAAAAFERKLNIAAAEQSNDGACAAVEKLKSAEAAMVDALMCFTAAFARVREFNRG